MTTKFFAPITHAEAVVLATRTIVNLGHLDLVAWDTLETGTVVVMPRPIDLSEATEAHNEAVMDVACVLSTVANVEINVTPCGMVYCKVS